jgi:hypothetical protein
MEGIAIAKNYGVGAISCSYSQFFLSLVSLFVVGHGKLRREKIDFLAIYTLWET